MPHAFFVYGTLKQGQVNYPLLAPYARAATPATTRGQLRDVGLFPALIDAEGTVRGEVIALDPAAMPAALALIDELEGFQPADPDGSMYVRRAVVAQLADGTTANAYAYFYNRDPHGLVPIAAGEWSGPSSAALADEGEEMAAFKAHVRGFLRRAGDDGDGAGD